MARFIFSTVVLIGWYIICNQIFHWPFWTVFWCTLFGSLETTVYMAMKEEG